VHLIGVVKVSCPSFAVVCRRYTSRVSERTFLASTFVVSVFDVFFVSAAPQMLDFTARRVVAAMQHMRPISRYWLAREQPCDSVRKPGFPAQTELPVTGSVEGSSPNQAPSVLVSAQVLLEPLNVLLGKWHRKTYNRSSHLGTSILPSWLGPVQAVARLLGPPTLLYKGAC